MIRRPLCKPASTLIEALISTSEPTRACESIYRRGRYLTRGLPILPLPGFPFQKMPVVFDAEYGPCIGGLRGAIVFKEIEAGAVLENCRALIDQITAWLSAEEPFVNVSSAAELL